MLECLGGRSCFGEVVGGAATSKFAAACGWSGRCWWWYRNYYADCSRLILGTAPRNTVDTGGYETCSAEDFAAPSIVDPSDQSLRKHRFGVHGGHLAIRKVEPVDSPVDVVRRRGGCGTNCLSHAVLCGPILLRRLFRILGGSG